MKKIPTFGMAFSMFVAILPSAYAAGTVVRTEPNNGFIQAENPEWTSAHQSAASNAPNHRQYHRDAETARVSWLNLHLSERGTAMYENSYRAMLQLRNMLHRQYHMAVNLQDSSALPSVIVISPNGGETYNRNGSLTIHWQTRNVPATLKFDTIKLRSTVSGQEYLVATDVLNDGSQVIVPDTVPSGWYKLEMKTYVSGTLVEDSSDAAFQISNPSN